MTDMTCELALDRMLEADPAELRGEADTDLARHITGCHRCGAVAATMLAELEAVDVALATFAAGGPPAADRAAPDREADARVAADAAADAALGAIRSEADRDVAWLDRRRSTNTRWLRAAWIPLAAAAALAGILVVSQDDPFPGTPAGPVDAPGADQVLEPRVAVTPPPDRAAAIMETENPNITIVWLYEREGS